MSTLIRRPLSRVEDVLCEYLPGIDVQAAEAILAALLANELEGPPVWLMAVAPPSTGKTLLIEPCEGISGAILLSSITPFTLLSGHRTDNGDDPSLLTRLGKRPVVLLKELGTILEDARNRSEIFSQLREVYDGTFSKSFGTGATRTWQGKATVIAGITPAVDLYSLDPLLGPRFFKFRFQATLSPEEVAKQAWRTTGQEKATRDALNAAYKHALAESRKGIAAVELSDTTQERLAALAALLVQMRAGVERNKYRQDRIELPPQPESPARAMKALKLFATALAALRGETDLSDLGLIYRIVFDSMPEPRRSIVLAAIAAAHESGEPFRVDDLHGIVSPSYTYDVVDDLTALRVFANAPSPKLPTRGRPPKFFNLTKSVQRWLSTSGALDYAVKLHLQTQQEDT